MKVIPFPTLEERNAKLDAEMLDVARAAELDALADKVLANLDVDRICSGAVGGDTEGLDERGLY